MIRARVVRLAIGLSLLALAGAPAGAWAAETTRLNVAFNPYKLGADTTISSTFEISTTNGQLPSPPTKFNLQFPASLVFSTSGLGLSICNSATLETEGVSGCPPDSVIGLGSALVEVPVGPEPVQEKSQLTVLKGPPQGEQAGVLIYADGETPVSAQVLFQGSMLESSRTFGELLETNLPLIPSVPGAGDALVLETKLSIGSVGLTYYENEHSHTMPYHPRGIEVPEKCPSGGFQFGLTMQFADGSTVVAKHTIPCPVSHLRRSRHERSAGRARR
jgi:hypothetical protein